MSEDTALGPPHARAVLALLGTLFLCRILGQALQAAAPVPWLPEFALWHSAALPYPALLLSQVIILAAMALAILRLPDAEPQPALGRLLCWAAAVYAAVMATRFAFGAANITGIAWFDAPIATPIHLGLAGFLFLCGVSWLTPEQSTVVRQRLGPWVRRLSYPAAMASVVALYFWLRRDGAPLTFAAYLPVVLGAAAVLAHELALPFRKAWTPRGREVVNDGLFMGLVQMLLPALLSLALVALIASDGTSSTAIWPHHWPVPAQALLMLLAADVLRYWLHRAAHAWMPLWRLHAVHHSPGRLYFFNVGRFHPLEKTLQFLLDAAPFVLLGVSGEVVSAYFVFFAVNGFYQHTNADVRLGWLNWLVSGPELHRWHHSVLAEESDRNFGNNLIVWDMLFGTRFLPRDRLVGDLGLHNKSYPTSFVSQTLAPVTTNPNAG